MHGDVGGRASEGLGIGDSTTEGLEITCGRLGKGINEESRHDRVTEDCDEGISIFQRMHELATLMSMAQHTANNGRTRERL